MKVEYQLTATAICPVDGNRRDVYELRVAADHMIPVEEILAAASAFSDRAVFQEDLTQQLADRLDARVVTAGDHSGVATRCVARPSLGERRG